MTKKQKGSRTRAVPRAFYDPAIRDVIAEGNLAQMKRVLLRASAVLKEQGDLAGAIKRLENAIAKQERA